MSYLRYLCLFVIVVFKTYCAAIYLFLFILCTLYFSGLYIFDCLFSII